MAPTRPAGWLGGGQAHLQLLLLLGAEPKVGLHAIPLPMALTGPHRRQEGRHIREQVAAVAPGPPAMAQTQHPLLSCSGLLSPTHCSLSVLRLCAAWSQVPALCRCCGWTGLADLCVKCRVALAQASGTSSRG